MNNRILLLGAMVLNHASADVSGPDGVNIDCDSAYTTIDVNACLAREYREADKVLNQQYNKAMAYMRSHDAEWDTRHDPRLLSVQLRDAQRSWIKQRDMDCDVKYNLYIQGTIRTAMGLGCKIEMTKQRTQFLRGFGPIN